LENIALVTTDRHLFLEVLRATGEFYVARNLVSVQTRHGTNIFDVIYYSEIHDAGYIKLNSLSPGCKPLKMAEEKNIRGGQTVYGSSLREGNLTHMRGIILDFEKDLINTNTQGSHGYSGISLYLS
jgi:hypothetical protein